MTVNERHETLKANENGDHMPPGPPYKKGEVPTAKYERNREIFSLHQMGMLGSDIAKKYGLTRQAVNAILKREGVPRSTQLLAYRRALIADYIREGRTAKQISQLTGESISYIQKLSYSLKLPIARNSKTEIDIMLAMIQLALKGGPSIAVQTKDNRPLREKIYRLAEEQGVVWNWRSKAKARRKAIKRIEADG